MSLGGQVVWGRSMYQGKDIGFRGSAENRSNQHVSLGSVSIVAGGSNSLGDEFREISNISRQESLGEEGENLCGRRYF